MLVSVDLEQELVAALLGHVGDIGLQAVSDFSPTPVGRQRTNQVEDTSGDGLVLGALGEEEQTLASLASPGGNGVGNGRLLVLVEHGQVLGLDGLLAEVEETLGEAQTPKNQKIIR